ncbi:hypothetical protein HRbin36_00984 [bacterium HR36]|nr:hypothetical protein HRbin36_00984 [bacterium HR36]
MVVRPAELLFPEAFLQGVRIVVIARHVKERHLQAVNEAIEFAPFRLKLVEFFGVSFDQIAD